MASYRRFRFTGPISHASGGEGLPLGPGLRGEIGEQWGVIAGNTPMIESAGVRPRAYHHNPTISLSSFCLENRAS
jgi:hypothetical protein